MSSNLIDRIRLLFRKDKELYFSLRKIIGFYPHRIDFYRTALVHRSSVHRRNSGKPTDNERLEYLGDAVLESVVSAILYEHFPNKSEGFLTNLRSRIVQRTTLNQLAQQVGLEGLIRQDSHSHGQRCNIPGNAFEALVGAIYLDGGYDACMQFMERRILAQLINIDKVAYKEVNFKSKLLEWSQKNRVKMEFRDVKQAKDGSTGSPVFTTQVFLEGLEGCTGTGYSKKESQQQASKETLQRLRREPQFIDAIFAAKADRTKMEEEPVMAAPDIDKLEYEQQNFIIEQEKPDAADTVDDTPSSQPQTETDDDMSLDDITATPREKSREEIIAEAEAAAFEEA